MTYSIAGINYSIFQSGRRMPNNDKMLRIKEEIQKGLDSPYKSRQLLESSLKTQTLHPRQIHRTRGIIVWRPQ